VRLIAAGGAGEVYEAVHDFTGRAVALECLQLRHSKRADLQNRMRMEAVVLGKIRHANVAMQRRAGAEKETRPDDFQQLPVSGGRQTCMRGRNPSRLASRSVPRRIAVRPPAEAARADACGRAAGPERGEKERGQ
jgi:serine/threonine protein kinase